MTQQERQSALDKAKWILSEQKGHDCCGEFEYCAKCDKSINDPCAIAFNLYNTQKPAITVTSEPKKTVSKTEQPKPTNSTDAQITKPKSAPARSRSGRKLAGTK